MLNLVTPCHWGSRIVGRGTYSASNACLCPRCVTVSNWVGQTVWAWVVSSENRSAAARYLYSLGAWMLSGNTPPCVGYRIYWIWCLSVKPTTTPKIITKTQIISYLSIAACFQRQRWADVLKKPGGSSTGRLVSE